MRAAIRESPHGDRLMRTATSMAVGLSTMLTAAAAGMAFQPAFGTKALLVPVAVAAATATVTVATTRWLAPGRPLLVLFVSGAAWLLSATLTLSPTGQGGVPILDQIPAALDGVATGWSRLLDTTLPTAPDPRLLAVPFGLTWIAAATSVALGTGTSGGAVLPILPSLASLVAALVLATTISGGNDIVVVVFVVGAAMTVWARRVDWFRTGEATADPALFTGQAFSPAARGLWYGVAVALTLTTIAAVLLPLSHVSAFASRTAYDPRRHRAVRVGLGGDINPLTKVSGWWKFPNQVLFSTRSPTSGTWRLTVLDHYDGTSWSSSDGFLVAGKRTPPYVREPAHRSDPQVTQQIAIAGLTGLPLPEIGRPIRVSGNGILIAPASGALTRTKPLAPGFRYTVRYTILPRPSFTALASAHAPIRHTSTATSMFVATLPTKLREFLTTAENTAPTPFEQLIWVQQQLQDGCNYDPSAAPGSSLGRMASFCRVEGADSAEQFATALALVARGLGVPSRLVVGFAPGHRDPASGQYVVRSGDALVWPEVKFAETGWVAFSLTPRREDQPKPGPGVTQRQAASNQTPRTRATTRKPPPTSNPPAPTTPRNSSHPPATATRIVRLLAFVGVIVVLGYTMTILLLPPWWRRHIRRSGSPANRILYAWTDATDLIAVLAGREPKSATAADLLVEVEKTLPTRIAHPLRSLLALANPTAFSPRAASSADARRAWQLNDDFRKYLLHSTSRHRRVKYILAPTRTRTVVWQLVKTQMWNASQTSNGHRTSRPR